MELSPLQREGADWLSERPRRYLADPPGFGKTRQIMAAIGSVPTLVVCPAAIRDAGVWQTEALKVGWDAPLKVISYHQLAGAKTTFDPLKYKALVFDEAHHLKNRKVSWGLPAEQASKLIPKVYAGSGTPTPNDASELWGQLRCIRHDMPAFWKWADGNTRKDADGWFHISSNRHSDYVIGGQLQACVVANCHNAKEVTDRDCAHWAEFRAREQQAWMLGRPEEALDLPGLSGDDTPLMTPMKPSQAKLYRELKKEFLASLPEHGIELESLSDSQKFIHLWMLSTGVSSIDPGQDPDDRHSGKLALAAELLDGRTSPAIAATYFRNSALAIGRVCERIGKSYAFFGSTTSPAERRKAVDRFQAGEIDVMIGSIAVVGEGLTLTAADGVMLVERMWTPDRNKQVIRRAHRRGQVKEVGVRQLVTPKSVDEGQWKALATKRKRISRVDVTRLLEGDFVELP